MPMSVHTFFAGASLLQIMFFWIFVFFAVELSVLLHLKGRASASLPSVRARLQGIITMSALLCAMTALVWVLIRLRGT